jgi:SlyX protein
MNTTDDMNDKLIDLQTRVAYQEDTLMRLDQVITKQDADIIQLQQQVRLLVKRLDESVFVQEQNGGDGEFNDRPPHY